jgi:hypothetical protein
MLPIAYVIGSITVAVGAILGFRDAVSAERAAAKEAKERMARSAAERTARDNERHAAVQRQISALRQLRSEAQSEALTLAMTIAEAVTDLNDAESELAKPRYSPFWASLEQAAAHLTRFDAGVRLIAQRKEQYERGNVAVGGLAPAFSLGNATIPDPRAVFDRLRALYLRAQENRDFAIVYEQRRAVAQLERTNAILTAGFASLHAAVQDLGERMTHALDQLRESVTVEIADLRVTLESTAAMAAEQRRTLLAEADASRHLGETAIKQIRDQAANRLTHEYAARRMLDNIQRGRKPRAFDLPES